MKKLIVLLVFIPFINYTQNNIYYSKTIVVEDLKNHLSILSSDSLQGRETGRIGQKKSC